MPDLRLIKAEILKLRRRRGLLVGTAVLTFVAVAIFFAVASILHITSPAKYGGAGGSETFETAMSILAMTAGIAGVLIGATAGGSDIESGVFRDLAATGRSRTALFFARVPGAWAIIVPAVLASVTLSAILALVLHAGSTAVTAGAIVSGGSAALVSGMLLSAAAVGLAAMAGSRGMVIGLVLAFQLGVSPLLAQLGLLGDGIYAIPSVAIARIGGAMTNDVGLVVAIGVVIAWATATLGAGLYRTRTQEI
jgi:ABC-type transport system involved in multi-copper enzyme maturation permease subunit